MFLLYKLFVNVHLLFPVEAPSYDRRVSDLLRAATEPTGPARDSSTGTDFSISNSPHDSIDGAVLGVARTTSLSVRAKALLTRAEAIVSESPETMLPYIVPSPSTSFSPSEASLVLAPSIVARVGPRTSPDTIDGEDSSEKRGKSPSHLSVPHTFGRASPESAGIGQPYNDLGEDIGSQRFNFSEVPHSAIPFNQSTPFQHSFPNMGIPSAYKHPKHADSFNIGELSRNSSQSKSRSHRSSILTTISRASSRAARAMSWFRKKPLPPLPASPTRGKEGKALPHPDDDMSVLDLALRAATLDQYLSVGELPYNSPRASPLPPGQEHVQGSSMPRMSIQSVLSSMSDRARRERKKKSVGFSQIPEGKLEPHKPRNQSHPFATKRRKIWAFALFWCVLAIAVPIGVVFGRRALGNISAATNCSDGMVGASCQLSK